MDALYFDYNATTPIAPEVREAMLPWFDKGWANPSSNHEYGRQARAAIDEARQQVAASIGAEPDEIVFTSGGTEANNLAIRGVAEALSGKPGFVTSTIEHPATAGPLAWLEQRGARVTRVAVDDHGQVSARDVLDATDAGTALITVMLANNETGAIQPIGAIGRGKGETLLHTDAAQAIGKIPVDVDALGVDLLSIAGHKLYAPKGIGALYVRRGTPIRPFMRGGGHERGLRPGTENTPYIVALGAACTLAAQHAGDDRIARLTAKLLDLLRARVEGLRLHGPETHRLPNTLNLGFPGVTGTDLLAQAPAIAASTGSACHEDHEDPSAVLLAMGLSRADALGAVRLSLGRDTTEAQVDRAADLLVRAWQVAR